MYLILAAFLLVSAYIGVLWLETRRASRFFSERRARLDALAAQAAFIAAHVDFASFARENIRDFARRAVHDAAHISLRSVRAAERALNRLVRRLHSAGGKPHGAGGSTRTFVRALSEFKGHIEATRPEPRDIVH